VPKGSSGASNGTAGGKVSSYPNKPSSLHKPSPNQQDTIAPPNQQDSPSPSPNQNTTTTYEKTEPVGNNVNEAFKNFVNSLFGIADGNTVDIEEPVDSMVSVLCERDTSNVRETLIEYVDELCKLMDDYQEGSTASEWSGCSSKDSVSNSEQIERIRFLSAKLNSQFENCVSYNGAGLGTFFGILATSLVSYKNKKDKHDYSSSENIRNRVMNYIQNIN
jgi:hypothetical protein